MKKSVVFDLSEKLTRVERDLGTIFKELLFVHNLKESSAAVLNEMEFLELTGDFIWQKARPDFLAILLYRKEKDAFVDIYQKSRGRGYRKLSTDAAFRRHVRRAYRRGKSALHAVPAGTAAIPCLLVPLQAGGEKLGVLAFCRRAADELTTNLVLSCCAISAGHLANLKLYQQLLKNERMVAVGQTIAGLSHDIKNILTGLEGAIFLSNSAEETADWPALREALNLTQRSYQRLKNLVLDMVDFSKQRPPSYENGDINDFLRQLADVFRPGLPRGVSLVLALDEKLPRVLLDFGKLDRVVTNLLNNAVDAFGGKEGMVQVTTRYRPDAGRVELVIADNGCGIPPENLERIFEIFYSTKGARGTGLGLALVKKIIADHQGQIQVSSKVGQGTSFTVTLPVKPA